MILPEGRTIHWAIKFFENFPTNQRERRKYPMHLTIFIREKIFIEYFDSTSKQTTEMIPTEPENIKRIHFYIIYTYIICVFYTNWSMVDKIKSEKHKEYERNSFVYAKALQRSKRITKKIGSYSLDIVKKKKKKKKKKIG